MKNPGRIAAGAILLLCLTSNTGAQMMRQGPPDMHGIWNPVIGAGAAYEMQGKTGEKTSMEFAIVGKESINGKDGYWMEITMNSARTGGEMVMKNLVVLDGQNTQTAKFIMQMPGSPPMEMTQMMQRSGRAQHQSADIRTSAEDAGSESITVPGGTFTAEHYRMKDGSGDVWVARSVSPYGMVKYQGKDTTMVLTKVVTNAKDKITGTPQPFNPAAFGQQPQ